MFRLLKNVNLRPVFQTSKDNISKLEALSTTHSFRSYSSKIEKIDHHNLKPDTSSIIHYEKTNMPVEMEDPYLKEKQLCILCKHKITPSYKNVRLLSQFVSRFTGRVYGRHITGLCKAQQLRLEEEIGKAMRAGLMPEYFRDPRFSHDPLLYDPDHPFRPHRY